MMTTMLEVEALHVRFNGCEAISGLSLKVNAGSVYALLGGNGAGKTTTINAVMGFVQPAAGQIRVGGHELGSAPQNVRDLLAYLPENVALYSYMSGIENLIYFCALAGLKVSATKAQTLLDAVGLQSEFQRQRVARYSKGMRQKVGLAIANAKQARLMLLDEPTSGLDPGAANDFAASLRQAREQGMAILMATHDLFNAVQVADRIGIMKAGVLVEDFDAGSVSHQALEEKYLLHTRAMQ
jgi:ABC-2 type transport system ATP-binding protein